MVKTFETPSSTSDLGKRKFKDEQCVHVYRKLQWQRRPEMLTLNKKADMKRIKALYEKCYVVIFGRILGFMMQDVPPILHSSVYVLFLQSFSSGEICCLL